MHTKVHLVYYPQKYLQVYLCCISIHCLFCILKQIVFQKVIFYIFFFFSGYHPDDDADEMKTFLGIFDGIF
jgi:hypothetical protein